MTEGAEAVNSALHSGSTFAGISLKVFAKLLEALSVIACALGQIVLATHFLPADQVGIIVLTSTCIFFASAFSLSGGIRGVITREIAQKRDKAAVLTNGVISHLSSEGALLVVLLFAYSWVPYDSQTKEIILWSLLPGLLGGPLLISEAYLSGQNNIGRTSALNIVANLSVLVGFSYGILHHWPIIVLVFVLNCGSLISGAYAYWCAPIHRYFHFASISLDEVCSMLREALPGLVIVISAAVYIRIDVLMIERQLGIEAVAHYSSAYSILDALMVLSNTVLGAFYPTFFRMVADTGVGKDKFYASVRGYYNFVLRFLGISFFPIAILIAFFAAPILEYIFGAAYVQAEACLGILMIAAIFACLNGPSAHVLFAFSRQHLYMWGTLLGAAINIIGNLLLIPLLGYTGAAVSTALTELALCMFSFLMVARTINEKAFAIHVNPEPPKG